MTEPLDSAIEDAAQGPARARGDQGEMQQHNLKDLIEADRYLAGKRAAAARRLGIRFLHLQPPGTV